MTAGQTATFTAAATGNPNPTVQWYDSTDGGATFTALSGATSTTLTFTTAAGDNGNVYEAVFTNSVGSATTTAAMLDVQTLPSPWLSYASDTVTAGQTATFTATTTHHPNFYGHGGSGSGYTFAEYGPRRLRVHLQCVDYHRTTATGTGNLYEAVFTFSNITITATDSSGEMGARIYSLTINPGRCSRVYESPSQVPPP